MLLKLYLALIQHVFRIGSWLVQVLFRVCSEFLDGWLGRVSGLSKVGLVIYLRLVPGWFRMYVGLVCALFGEVWVGVVYIGLRGVCLIGVL